MMVTFDICAGNPGALQFLMQAYDMDMFMPWILSLLSRGRPCTSLETHGGQEINSPQ